MSKRGRRFPKKYLFFLEKDEEVFGKSSSSFPENFFMISASRISSAFEAAKAFHHYFLCSLKYKQTEFIGHSRHFGFVGRQISRPKKEMAIPASFHFSDGNSPIICFSIFSGFGLGSSSAIPKRGATRRTCRSDNNAFCRISRLANNHIR